MITGDIAHLCTEIIHRHVENKEAKLKLEVARILIPKIRECYALKGKRKIKECIEKARKL